MPSEADVAQKNMIGVTTAPAAAAVPPRAPWTNRGTNVSTPKIVVPTSAPATYGAAVSRCVSSVRGTSGCSRPACRRAKTASSAAPMANISSRSGRCPRVPGSWSVASSSAVTPTVSVAPPIPSNGSGREAHDSRIWVASSTRETRPRGTITRKIDRQPKLRVRKAPRRGPIRLAVPQIALNSAWMRARSRNA